MRIGIISDTHGEVHKRIFEIFKGVDFIIHAGDFGSDTVRIELETIAPVKGVHGNVDDHDIRNRFPYINKFEISGVRFLLIHDVGSPERPIDEVSYNITSYNPDIVIFGHSHVPFSRYVGKVLYFNPGSASSGRQGHSETVGIFEISTDNTKVGHLKL